MTIHGMASFAATLRNALQAPRVGLLTMIVAALFALPMQQAAAQERPVTVELQQFKVVKDEAGNERLIDADTVKPGDIVEYRATYRNRTKNAVSGLVADLPIPEGMHYQAESAQPHRIPVEAAAQNRVYAREPLIRTVEQQDGTVREEQVPYSEYRALRWLIGQLPAGQETTVSARVQVAPLTVKLTAQQEVEKPAARTRASR